MTKKFSTTTNSTLPLFFTAIMSGCFAPPTRPNLPPWQQGITIEGTYGLNDNVLKSDSITREYLPSYALSARISKNILGHVADIGIASDGAFGSFSFYRNSNIELIGISKFGLQFGYPFQVLEINTAYVGYGGLLVRSRYCKQTCIDLSSGIYYESKLHEYSNDEFAILDSSEVRTPYIKSFSVSGYEMGIPLYATLSYKSMFLILSYHYPIQSDNEIKWEKTTSINFQENTNKENISRNSSNASWSKKLPLQLSIGLTF